MTADKRVKLEEKITSFLLENDSRQECQTGGKKYLLADKSVKLEEKSISFLLENDGRQKCQIGRKRVSPFCWKMTAKLEEKSISFVLENYSRQFTKWPCACWFDKS